MNNSHPDRKLFRDRFTRHQSKEIVKKILSLHSEQNTNGLLLLIFGPCYSGKTLSAIHFGRAAQEKQLSVSVVQPAIDRPGDIFEGFIQARNGETFPASSFSTENDIAQIFTGKKIVIINEFQFTPESLQDFLFETLVDYIRRGGWAIMAGLYYSSLRTIFPFSERIMNIVSQSFELKAVCESCGKPNAIYSQRLINGKPALANTPLFLGPSDEVTYVPRCITCHVLE